MIDRKRIKELLLYIVFGVLTTIVSWASYTFFINIFGFSVTLSNALSWVLSVMFAYVTNKVWVFNSNSWKINVLLKEITTFVSSRLFTGIIEMVGVPILEKLGFDNIFYALLQQSGFKQEILFTQGIYSKIAFAVIIVILNYVFSKIIVFNKKEKNDEKN